jgi:hypothetical protein
MAQRTKIQAEIGSLLRETQTVPPGFGFRPSDFFRISDFAPSDLAAFPRSNPIQKQ